MKLNTLEKIAMNNPVRSLVQRHVEAPLLERLGGKVEGLEVLEVGCGRGIGTELILERFGAQKVLAIDVDEAMVRRARKRLERYPPERLVIRSGDVTRIDAADQQFDAVFNFAAIHHVPVWQDAVAEVARVLKPSGRFFFLEVTAQWIHRWPNRVLFEHPQQNRFSSQQFIAEFKQHGIDVGSNWVERGKGSYLFGVGRRTAVGE